MDVDTTQKHDDDNLIIQKQIRNNHIIVIIFIFLSQLRMAERTVIGGKGISTVPETVYPTDLFYPSSSCNRDQLMLMTQQQLQMHELGQCRVDPIK